MPALNPALYPATVFVAGVAVFLFLRMFTRFYRDGFDLASLDMRGNDPYPVDFFDPLWGIFGARAGDASLLRVRAVLLVCAMPLALVQAWVGYAVVELWWAATFVVMELSLMYAAIMSQQQER